MKMDGVVAFVNAAFLATSRDRMAAAVYDAVMIRNRAVEVDIRARMRGGASLDELVICVWPDGGVNVARKDLEVHDVAAPRHYVGKG